MELLMHYPWPGNVRELENIMERIVTFCDHEVLKSSFIPDDIKEKARELQRQAEDIKAMSMKTYKDAKSETIEQFTKDYLECLLKEVDGKIRDASRISGMDRTCLYRLMKKYGVAKDVTDSE